MSSTDCQVRHIPEGSFRRGTIPEMFDAQVRRYDDAVSSVRANEDFRKFVANQAKLADTPDEG